MNFQSTLQPCVGNLNKKKRERAGLHYKRGGRNKRGKEAKTTIIKHTKTTTIKYNVVWMVDVSPSVANDAALLHGLREWIQNKVEYTSYLAAFHSIHLAKNVQVRNSLIIDQGEVIFSFGSDVIDFNKFETTIRGNDDFSISLVVFFFLEKKKGGEKTRTEKKLEQMKTLFQEAMVPIYSNWIPSHELVTIYITDKFPLHDITSEDPCLYPYWYFPSYEKKKSSRHVVVSLNDNLNGLEYLSCLKYDPTNPNSALLAFKDEYIDEMNQTTQLDIEMKDTFSYVGVIYFCSSFCSTSSLPFFVFQKGKKEFSSRVSHACLMDFWQTWKKSLYVNLYPVQYNSNILSNNGYVRLGLLLVMANNTLYDTEKIFTPSISVELFQVNNKVTLTMLVWEMKDNTTAKSVGANTKLLMYRFLFERLSRVNWSNFFFFFFWGGNVTRQNYSFVLSPSYNQLLTLKPKEKYLFDLVIQGSNGDIQNIMHRSLVAKGTAGSFGQVSMFDSATYDPELQQYVDSLLYVSGVSSAQSTIPTYPLGYNLKWDIDFSCGMFVIQSNLIVPIFKKKTQFQFEHSCS
ncbi:hypothetical protein RFI_05735 [Reticulomyxa filosa]|uniref:Uncharacterized protein n=1 Tax=Reticulomyxa filosa TaxID=46433 RepID=X6NZL9_RETFI|nr:hypothetical protein RFI_05735 [Reticulomyxa filosa]|eukprot:ETO31386.1 hypothetical protein RFI_05735 [Reticulomyxa filosa]